MKEKLDISIFIKKMKKIYLFKKEEKGNFFNLKNQIKIYYELNEKNKKVF